MGSRLQSNLKKESGGLIRTEAQILQRRIKLKRQAIPLIRAEIRQDQCRLALLEIKSNLESQINSDWFDPNLSRQLDAITVLLEG